METTGSVLEYKCPCCSAGLGFDEHAQKFKCDYCDNTFDIDSVQVFNESLQEPEPEQTQWDASDTAQWSDEDSEDIRVFTCPACGGELITDENTVATFCPFCDNPTILTGRISGGIKPDAVIPFRTSKEDAQEAFLSLCKGKPLLPKLFTQKQRIEKITGIYVPFWLYDCKTDFSGAYRATRVQTWMDSNYTYTRTSHYLLKRSAAVAFQRIPMDASSKMDDAVMESIEPFDYSQMVDFDKAYLSGFFADKYDVEAESGHERVRQRVSETVNGLVNGTLSGYASVTTASKKMNVTQGKVKYVLLPVWMLLTKYKDSTYLFAMNGQTGKMTGTFPICTKRSWAWFGGLAAAVAAVSMLIYMLV